MMHHRNLLITIHFFVATSLCNAMEIASNIINPRSVAYLNNMIAVGGNNGCRIFNAVTQQEMRTLSSDKIYHIAGHSNKKYLAIASDKELTVFNAKTGNPLWTQEPFRGPQSIAFCPNNHSSLLAYNNNKELLLYNFKNGLSETYSIQCSFGNLPLFSPHPLEEEMIYPMTKTSLAVISINILRSLTITEIFKAINGALFNGEYNHDGSLIALNGINFCTLFNPVDDSSYDLKNEKNICIKSMVFHPTRPLLALLTTIFEQHASEHRYRDIVQYWSVTTKKLIATTKILSPVTLLRPDDAHTKRLAFSPDGTQLIAALEYTCVSLPVPNNDSYDAYSIPSTSKEIHGT